MHGKRLTVSKTFYLWVQQERGEAGRTDLIFQNAFHFMNRDGQSEHKSVLSESCASKRCSTLMRIYRRLKQSGSVIQFSFITFFSVDISYFSRVISFSSHPVLLVQTHYVLFILSGIIGSILGSLY